MGLLKVNSSGLGSEGNAVPFEAVGEGPCFAVTVGKPDFALAVSFKKAVSTESKTRVEIASFVS